MFLMIYQLLSWIVALLCMCSLSSESLQGTVMGANKWSPRAHSLGKFAEFCFKTHQTVSDIHILDTHRTYFSVLEYVLTHNEAITLLFNSVHNSSFLSLNSFLMAKCLWRDLCLDFHLHFPGPPSFPLCRRKWRSHFLSLLFFWFHHFLSPAFLSSLPSSSSSPSIFPASAFLSEFLMAFFLFPRCLHPSPPFLPHFCPSFDLIFFICLFCSPFLISSSPSVPFLCFAFLFIKCVSLFYFSHLENLSIT